jgi:hypothetical protein
MTTMETSAYYTRNRKLLERRFPSLAAAIDTFQSGLPRIEQTPQGLSIPVCMVDGRAVQVHSKYDPVREAARLTAESGAGKANMVVVSVFDSVSYRELLAVLKPDAVLLVVEHSIALLKAAMLNAALDDVLGDPA